MHPESSTPPATAGLWLRAARRPRIVVLGVVAVVLVISFALLGAWQFERSGITGAERAEAERAERLAAEPVPIEEVLAPQSAFPADALGRPVTATGRFDPDQQVLVRGRGIDGERAVLVVSALHLTEGPHAGAILPVLRGWYPEADIATFEAGSTDLSAPEPPEGEIEALGYLAASEASDPTPWPPGQSGAISAGELVNLWGTPIFNAYLVLQAPEQPEALTAAPPPDLDLGTGRDPRNLAYAIEWWIFAVFTVLFWLKVWRDDVRDLRAAHAATQAEVPSEPGEPAETTDAPAVAGASARAEASQRSR